MISIKFYLKQYSFKLCLRDVMMLSCLSFKHILLQWRKLKYWKQVEKFKYLGVVFTSDGRQDEELDTRIGKASAVMRALHNLVVMKRELSKKAKLSIFKAVFVPILTRGHESSVMTKRMRSQVQASEMRFLRRIEGVTLFNKMCSSEQCSL